MNLENYLAKSNEPFEEIRLEFCSDENIEQLCKLLKEIGYNQYIRFVFEHQEDILQYIGLTHSRRAQKKWMNRTDIWLIRLAALQISRVTALSLSGVRNALIVPAMNGSYREFHTAVAEGVFQAIRMNPFAYFPFEGYDNPFFS